MLTVELALVVELAVVFDFLLDLLLDLLLVLELSLKAISLSYVILLRLRQFSTDFLLNPNSFA